MTVVDSRRRNFLIASMGAASLFLVPLGCALGEELERCAPVDWSGELYPVRQPDRTDLCWLAAAAMVQSWLLRKTVSLGEAARSLGSIYESLFAAGDALPGDRIPALADELNMKTAPLATWSLEWWADRLASGPVVVIGMSELSTGPHARVLVGMIGSDPLDWPSTIIRYVDPLVGAVGARAVWTMDAFYESLPARRSAQLPPTQVLFFEGDPVETRIAYAVQEDARVSKRQGG